MANFEETTRTNYVKVKDMDGLTKALEGFDIEVWERDGAVAFGGGSEGYWPSYSAQAWTAGGESIQLTLGDIYEMAEKLFSVPPDSINVAEY